MLQLPNVSHDPAESVADWRSTTTEAASTPEPASLPVSIVSGTEIVVYHGPPERDADWPDGPVESGAMRIEAEAVTLELFVTSISWSSGLPAAPAVQE